MEANVILRIPDPLSPMSDPMTFGPPKKKSNSSKWDSGTVGHRASSWMIRKYKLAILTLSNHGHIWKSLPSASTELYTYYIPL